VPSGLPSRVSPAQNAHLDLTGLRATAATATDCAEGLGWLNQDQSPVLSILQQVYAKIALSSTLVKKTVHFCISFVLFAQIARMLVL
jgi:hypothetical protein